MTSKEAFEEIIKVCNLYHRQIANVDVDSIHGYPIKKIKKDLEALEILKKYIYYSTKSSCIRMKDMYKRTTNFDYEDLKEWLENGQRKNDRNLQ